MKYNKSSDKVLIISSWAPPMVGGPQNLYTIFSNIFHDYAIFTSRTMIEEAVQGGVLGTWLPCKYYSFEGGEMDKSKYTKNSNTVKSIPTIKGLFYNLFKSIPFVGEPVTNLGSIIYSIIRNLKTGTAVVSMTKAGVLLGISDSGLGLISTWLLSKKTKRPYVLYLFDLYLGSLLKWPYSWIAKLLERSIVTNASLVILTNEVTKEYYKNRYGNLIHTAIIHNSISKRQQITDYNPQPPYYIVFTGHIYWAQEQAVMNLISAMTKLADLPLQLKLFVPKAPNSIISAIHGKQNILLTSAPQSEMPKVQSEASLLFLPLAWNTKAPDIIATATPGKFTDYLASGRPMLIHAPEYSYVSKYTKKNNLGLVVDQNSVEILANKIRSYITDPTIGQQYIHNSLQVFQQNHDVQKNVVKFSQLLSSIE